MMGDGIKPVEIAILYISVDDDKQLLVDLLTASNISFQSIDEELTNKDPDKIILDCYRNSPSSEYTVVYCVRLSAEKYYYDEYVALSRARIKLVALIATKEEGEPEKMFPNATIE